jgi:transcriptional antiterminator Rof (Rho-off)
MATSVCKNCSKEFKFFDSQKSGQFCSRECNHDYRIKLIMKSGKGNKTNASTYLKRFVDYKCSCCGLVDWQGKTISLQLDHIDGNRKNETLQNIRWLCYNCDPFTPHFSRHKHIAEKNLELILEHLNGS